MPEEEKQIEQNGIPIETNKDDTLKVNQHVPTTVFLAAYPTEQKPEGPDYLDELRKKHLVLNPAMDFNKMADYQIHGKPALSYLPEDSFKNMPTKDKKYPFNHMMARDYWCLRQSELVLYDIESQPGLHFIAASHIFKRPVVIVSEYLESIPQYFASQVKCTIKPGQLLHYIESEFNA